MRSAAASTQPDGHLGSSRTALIDQENDAVGRRQSDRLRLEAIVREVPRRLEAGTSELRLRPQIEHTVGHHLSALQLPTLHAKFRHDSSAVMDSNPHDRIKWFILLGNRRSRASTRAPIPKLETRVHGSQRPRSRSRGRRSPVRMIRTFVIMLTVLGCAEKLSTVGTDEPVAIGESMTGDEFHAGDGHGTDDTGTVGPEVDAEICDGIDNDGDGEIDEGVMTTFYVDGDADGFGNTPTEACEATSGLVTIGGDCDDENAAVHPEAEEICNDIDDDCDDAVDEALSETFFEDADGDGYGNPAAAITACAVPDGYTENALDCDDSASLVSPGATEVCNGVDDNCDGRADEGVGMLLYPDLDSDGFGDTSAGLISCWELTDHVPTPGDCDDTDFAINPDADEACDFVDNDCDGIVDEFAVSGLSEFWMDIDGDGHGAGETLLACRIPDGFVDNNDDCDDMDPLRSPSQPEVCNGYDDDCDSEIDEGVMSAFFADIDGDGWGAGEAFFACELTPGAATTSVDCDDTRADTYPGAEEVCDGLDNDCNAIPDDDPVDGETFYADIDGDGFGDAAVPTIACEPPEGYVENYTDCGPADDTVYPGAAERCDDRDNDCDGMVDDDPVDAPEWFIDYDGDGFGSPDFTMTDCSPDEGFVASSEDCDDDDPDVNPEAEEVCNDIDDNCDGVVDLDAEDGELYFYDADGDGFGSAESSFRCVPDDMWVDNDDDCDDDDDDVYPFAEEDCDGQDQDCNGLPDDGADCPCQQMNWSENSYMYCDSRKKWHEARDYCEDYGYTLVTVSNYSEQSWLLSTIRGDWRVTNSQYWTGLNDRSSERGSSRTGWTWRSGESFSYEAWADGPYRQPDNWGGEDCVELNRWTSNPAWSDWNDLDCNDRLRFVCEAG